MFLQYNIFKSDISHIIFGAVILYFCIGWQSLHQHVLVIYQSLQSNNITQAREQLSWVVSRDTQMMNEAQITDASIETTLENGCDAIFASFFWFIILGPWAAVLHRLSNTLDAMWGYKDSQFKNFGWCAAKMDDVLNYLPARLCAFIYALLGNVMQGLNCWRTQAKHCKSPNGGIVMTAGAGALNIRLGGPAYYHGKIEEKPYFGSNQPTQINDIKRSLKLIDHSVLIWLILTAALSFLIY